MRLRQPLAFVPGELAGPEYRFAINNVPITLGAVDTDIISLPAQAALTNDLVLIWAGCKVAKGIPGGITDLYFKNTGTASITFDAISSTRREQVFMAADEFRHFYLAGAARIIASGTVLLTLVGRSEGSIASVAIGDGSIAALVMRGAVVT